MRFVVDAQLPPALARWLANEGHDAVHVFDIGLGSAKDRDLWEHAIATSTAIVTKDEDFAARVSLAEKGPAVAWIRVGNTRTRELLATCSAVWPAVVRAIEEGDRLIEIA